MNVSEAGGQYVGFRSPDGRVEGDQLAVDVAEAHRVGVDDRQAAHTAAGDHLGGVGAYATQTDHQNMGLSQPGGFFRAEQQFRPLLPVVS